MLQHDLRPPPGSRHARKRVGRGYGSGHGTYAGRGLKGQKARSGGGVRPGFEGGQLPLIRRMARKRGFTNRFRVEYSTVSLARLAGFEAGTEVTPEVLHQRRIVRTLRQPIKVLADGTLSAALTVHAHAFSAKARQAIEAAGGRAVVIGAPEVLVEPVSEAAAPAPEAEAAAPEASAPEAEAPAPETAAPRRRRAAAKPAAAAEAEAPATAEGEAPAAEGEKKPARRRRKQADAEEGSAEA